MRLWRRRPARRQAAAILVLCVLSLVFALLGANIALRAFSAQTVRTQFADVDTQAHLARHGRLALGVPLVDWGVGTDARGLPLSIKAKINNVNRDRAQTAIGPNPKAPQRSLAQVRADGKRVIGVETVATL